MSKKVSATNLLLIYLLTMMGSSLTTVVSFLSVETSAIAGAKISHALAIRTIGIIIFSYLAPSVLHILNEKRGLIFAQVFGALALLILIAGFQFSSPWLIYFGILITAFPGVVTLTGLLSTLRAVAGEEDQFRLFSSRREMIAGVTLMMAGFVGPIALQKFGVTTLLIFDGLTYLLATLLLSVQKFPDNEIEFHTPVFPKLSLLTSKPTRHFILTVSGSLVFLAMLPLVASSGEFRGLLGLKSEIFETLWGIEGMVAILGGFIYPKIRKRKFIMGGVYLNAIPFLVVILVDNVAVKYFMLGLIPVFYFIAFLESRDTYILKATSSKFEVNSHIAASNLIRAFWGTISPFLLLQFVSGMGAFLFGVVILGLQALELLIRKRVMQ